MCPKYSVYPAPKTRVVRAREGDLGRCGTVEAAALLIPTPELPHPSPSLVWSPGVPPTQSDQLCR